MEAEDQKDQKYWRFEKLKAYVRENFRNATKICEKERRKIHCIENFVIFVAADLYCNIIVNEQVRITYVWRLNSDWIGIFKEKRRSILCQ